MDYTTDTIRNVAIAGHGDTGKTTLVEQILFNGKIINQAQTVESGNTVSDFTEEEIKRKISIHTTLSHVDWKKTKINLLDTPGSSDFVGEVVASFRSCESSVILVGARSGVQIETVKLWRRLDHRKMPRIIFVNKMEKDRADFFKVIENLKSFNVTFIPMSLPMGSGSEYQGVINLLNMKAYPVSGGGKEENAEEIPEAYKEQAQKLHEQMIEAAAEGDEELLEKYFAEGTLTIEEAKKGLQEGIAVNKFVPVFCGSALLNSGITPLMDFIAFDSPSPSRIEEPCMTGEKSQIISSAGDFSGVVFKTTIDQFSGKLSFVKVITGVLRPDSEVYNPREEKKTRISKIFTRQGKKLIEIKEVIAGDIAIITKIDDLRTNDTLCNSNNIIHYMPLQLPQPVHSLAVSTLKQKDEDKLSQVLTRVSEEDLTFSIKFNPETKQTVISGMGELHINMILNKVRENYKIEIHTETPKIPYREAITKKAQAEYTHKKQSGGHGQYARVVIEFEPINNGDHFVMTNAIKGGAISKGYLPGIEKGLLEAMSEGHLAGYPLVGIHATVLDGKEHPVDSSEMAFKLAAKGSIKTALDEAGAVLLEPIMDLYVIIEEQYLGDVLGDLSVKRARVQGQDMLGNGIMKIEAKVPQGELLKYAIDLRSITSGTGAFEMSFDHYEAVTGKTAQDIIKEAKK